MVELVDTQDLKSCSRKRSAGSIPALSTKARYMSVSGFCFLRYGDNTDYRLMLLISYLFSGVVNSI